MENEGGNLFYLETNQILILYAANYLCNAVPVYTAENKLQLMLRITASLHL